MTSPHTGTIERLSFSKRAVALLLFPLAFLLSACDVDAAVTVGAAGSMDITVAVTGDKDSMNLSAVSCESYGIYLRNFPNLEVKDYTNDVTTDVLCEIKGHASNAIDGDLLTDTDSTYVLRLPLKEIVENKAMPYSADNYSLVVHMPGDIVSASNGGAISGSDVTFSGRIADLDSDIEVEANKAGSNSTFLWVLGFLVALFLAAVLLSRYLHKQNSLPVPSLFGFMGKKKDKGEKKDDAEDKKLKSSGVSASTTDSTVALAPLPDKYAPKGDGSTSESYSEQIGMVDPLMQGNSADVVKRDVVMLDLPPETAITSPIPGMPPRIPMPDELFAGFVGDVSEEVVPDFPETSADLSEDKSDFEDSLDSIRESIKNDEFDDGDDAFFSHFLDLTEDEGLDEETGR
ncbi:MAG: hypothetical protein IKZ87_06280 [Actinomycetaceae bacterium]|nr:hypothetical protein [Actinomycetaceae bacterium]